MATSDEENPFWPTRSCARGSSTRPARPAGTAASSTSTSSPACASRTPEVFEETHAQGARARRATGLVDGLRIDHPDGLAEPARVPRAAARARRRRTSGSRRSSSPASSCATGRSRARPATSSRTTSTALFVDPAGEEPLTELYARADRRAAPLRGDRARGEARAGARRRSRRRSSGCARSSRRDGLEDARSRRCPSTARTSSRESGASRTPTARRVARRCPTELRRVAAARGARRTTSSSRASSRRPAPVMAKGVEDTAFYRYFRLARAERGRRRPRPLLARGRRLPRARTRSARERFPLQLLATADARHEARAATCARASARSRACPSEWAERVRRWRELDAAAWTTRTRSTSSARRSSARGRSCPTRLEHYLEKALREAKRNTNWIEPDEAHEARVQALRARALREPGVPRRLRAVRRSASRRPASARRSAQLLLQAHRRPGVPDIYQGDELWSLNLVDPDNRRPVDWSRHYRARTRDRRRRARR